jgi:formylglycine-generating enzyme required for sulfatase activity
MVFVRGGTFTLGTDRGMPDEGPAREVTVSSFFLDAHEVTNDQFAAFVVATGYVTLAEQTPKAGDFADVPADRLVPGAAVFLEREGWAYVPGAQWRHPEGPGSGIEGKGNHPVVQVAWEDAAAYARWAGKRLPTEAEWEYAAKAGRDQPEAIWGDAPFDDEAPQANIWQGAFPERNTNTDGFATTSPVGAFGPNPWGLFDMAGNVWEWCADWYRPDAYVSASEADPKGPADSFDPDEPDQPKRVLRGGSFLCAANYCRGYRPTARMKSSPDTGLMHVGFRCAKDVPTAAKR